MDSVVRLLRDGRIKDHEAACPVAVVCDDLSCAGGRDLMQRLVADYHAAFIKGLCQAGEVKLLMLEGSVRLGSESHLTVLDGCSDPAGWLRSAGAPVASSGTLVTPAGGLDYGIFRPTSESFKAFEAMGNKLTLLHHTADEHCPEHATKQLRRRHPANGDTCLLRAIRASGNGASFLGDVLQQLTPAPPSSLQAQSHMHQGSGSGSAFVIIDNLSPLLLYHPASSVLSFLERLRNHPCVSGVLTAIHADVVGGALVAGLERQATCVVRLEPVSDLQQEVLLEQTGQTAHGYVSCAFKSRKAGRLRTEGSFYSLGTQSGISFIAAPPQIRDLTPEMLISLKLKHAAASTSAPAPGSGGVVAAGATAPVAAAGSMRLTLTEQERQAKEAVVLPYEHGGAGQAGDWRDFLPTVAGGRAAGHHGDAVAAAAAAASATGSKLGEIHYVRDSDDENGGLHDSDEDLDDDLDI